ncbi:tRNA (cytidine32/guanosine34-2'-O)-methyltransferase [Angomonas deanei]|nr:tRNA (cytidine32/guanosine34-2'-O)-methyltransferase [Angomonas deanei]|eukprot:EPY18809.1 tRNA (cytidine32/guanosine34-2'-O)-methyltransferase [Angomonas deanei]
MHELDEYLQHQLLLAALLITTCVLEEGGTFVTKMFRGPNTPFLIHKSEVFFDQVRVVKPRSSRNASMEAFLLCQGFRLPCGYIPRLHLSASSDRADPNTAAQLALQGASDYTPEAPAYRSKEEEATALAVEDHTIAPGASIRWVAPFVACGDLSGFDADMNYDRDPASVVLPPVQPPLQAPYLPQKGHTTTHSTASSANETPTKKKKV